MKTRFLARMLLVIFAASLYPVNGVYGQTGSINNTLGTGGSFNIKDVSTTFLTLSQSTGYLSLNKSLTLPSTTGLSLGVIYKGANRFIHDYQASGTTGFNTFIGVNAGNFTMSGTTSQASYNTSVGNSSLSSLTTGSYNSAFGFQSLNANTTGSYNSAFGESSLYSNTTGYYNAAFGYYSLLSNTTGSYNSAFGYNSLYSNTTGADNSAFGYRSLQANTTGFDNSAFGYYSLAVNTTGSNNSAFGVSSLLYNTTGSNNSAFGVSSLASNTTGSYNSTFGESSLTSNTTGFDNSAFGYRSLQYNPTGFDNSAFGYQSLYSNITGSTNSAFGSSSLYSNTTGFENSAFGYWSLASNTTGSYNSTFGFYSLYANTTGFDNSAFGLSSLQYNTTGSYNSALGYYAGYNLTTGSNNTLIGYNAQPSSAAVSNEITLGNAGIGTLRCQVTSITALSDARDKKNIEDLALGLDFLMKVRPRRFHWDRREWYEDGKADGSKMQENPTAGFIAQELDEAQTKAQAEWLNLILKSNPDRLEATPGNLLPIMVKAIQELKTENVALRNEVVMLRASITEEVKKEVRAVLVKAVQPEETTVGVSSKEKSD